VSFAIPVYNSGSRLERLLFSIEKQDYPLGKIEILVADGGSTDNTIEIARKHCCKILKNPRKFAEPGKAICIDNARSELLCFVDDDNELPSADWLQKMVTPFVKDKEIVAAEPIRFEYTKKMALLDRYWALSGFNDPVFYYLGLYDKWNLVSDQWNGIDLYEKDLNDYVKFDIADLSKLVTLGANGFAVKTEVIKKINYHDLLDIDKVVAMIELGFNKFAKVKVGIYHYFCSDLKGYRKKAERKSMNVKCPSHVGAKGERRIKYSDTGFIKFALSTVTFFPLLGYSVKGFLRKRDLAWFEHVPVCWITLVIYAKVYLKQSVKMSA
jgi:glycosyltransferase involved in cell wall biosynthesis